MADVFTHLAVAKRYAEKNAMKNLRDFFDGNVLPDLTDDKEKTHYGTRKEKNDIIKRNLEKVGIKKFLGNNTIDSDLKLGELLHLYTDFEYYNSFMPQNYMKGIDHHEFAKDVIFTCDRCVGYIVKEYKISLGMTSYEKELSAMIDKFSKETDESFGKNFVGRIIYTEKELDEFIERVSSADLEKLQHIHFA